MFLTVPYLFGEKRRLVGPIGGCVAGAPHGLHVGDGHPQDGQLVGFPCEGAAGGDHVRQLSDVLGHFVASASLNLTVVLSETERKAVIHLERALTGNHQLLRSFDNVPKLITDNWFESKLK